jgi:GNAT superfamily N-acetyltransferase
MNVITIRRYLPTDLDEVRRLNVLALADAGEHAGSGPWDHDFSDIENHYIKNRGEFLVGVLDNQIVAIGALERTDGISAEIKRMRVHPDYQNKGYGQQILGALEGRARKLGYRRLHLDTTSDMAAARRLYVRNGYTEYGRRPEGRFTILLFQKDLT